MGTVIVRVEGDAGLGRGLEVVLAERVNGICDILYWQGPTRAAMGVRTARPIDSDNRKRFPSTEIIR